MGSQMNPLEYFICGGFGGVCTVLVGHPLDTVKVNNTHSNSYLSLLPNVIINQRFKGSFTNDERQTGGETNVLRHLGLSH